MRRNSTKYTLLVCMCLIMFSTCMDKEDDSNSTCKEDKCLPASSSIETLNHSSAPQENITVKEQETVKKNTSSPIRPPRRVDLLKMQSQSTASQTTSDSSSEATSPLHIYSDFFTNHSNSSALSSSPSISRKTSESNEMETKSDTSKVPKKKKYFKRLKSGRKYMIKRSSSKESSSMPSKEESCSYNQDSPSVCSEQMPEFIIDTYEYGPIMDFCINRMIKIYNFIYKTQNSLINKSKKHLEINETEYGDRIIENFMHHQANALLEMGKLRRCITGCYNKQTEKNFQMFNEMYAQMSYLAIYVDLKSMENLYCLSLQIANIVETFYLKVKEHNTLNFAKRSNSSSLEEGSSTLANSPSMPIKNVQPLKLFVSSQKFLSEITDLLNILSTMECIVRDNMNVYSVEAFDMSLEYHALYNHTIRTIARSLHLFKPILEKCEKKSIFDGFLQNSSEKVTNLLETCAGMLRKGGYTCIFSGSMLQAYEMISIVKRQIYYKKNNALSSTRNIVPDFLEDAELCDLIEQEEYQKAKTHIEKILQNPFSSGLAQVLYLEAAHISQCEKIIYDTNKKHYFTVLKSLPLNRENDITFNSIEKMKKIALHYDESIKSDSLFSFLSYDKSLLKLFLTSSTCIAPEFLYLDEQAHNTLKIRKESWYDTKFTKYSMSLNDIELYSQYLPVEKLLNDTNYINDIRLNFVLSKYASLISKDLLKLDTETLSCTAQQLFSKMHAMLLLEEMKLVVRIAHLNVLNKYDIATPSECSGVSDNQTVDTSEADSSIYSPKNIRHIYLSLLQRHITYRYLLQTFSQYFQHLENIETINSDSLTIIPFNPVIEGIDAGFNG
ncbi:hypothetical protein NEFER03_1492 [Nematocida sp. LUAm3]|nr:hypothetical protein NEFER03_1492 [Nematocida sp. LUAm3]KAI5174525.1 hypothetical protein NEFER02_0646 [Nematocida sp. LUAm2]KAI5178069.1 hypothetical protein NEFER01_1251 [Nematocida sp. LUAm1]